MIDSVRYDEIIDSLINTDMSDNKQDFPPVGDFHTANGIAFFGVQTMKEAYENDYHTFKNVLRDTAKRKGLALCYGLGWKGLLDVVNNDEQKAKDMHYSFFKNLPVVSKNMSKLLEVTKKNLYFTNLLGRRLYVRGWKSEDWRDQVSARNNTFNYGIQSLGADITKLILYKISQFVENNRLYKNAGNLITKHFISRILIADVQSVDLSELEFELDSLLDGHTKIIITKEGKPYQEFDRLVQIPMSVITKFNLKIFH